MKKLYCNGTIITMNEDQPFANSICIEDDRIVGVGTLEELTHLMGEGDQYINLKGHTMLPGFIDAHSHFTGVANSLSQCDLSSARSFSDIQRLLKEFIKEHNIAKGEWVYGCHYDHNDLIENKHPDKYILDAVDNEHPIVIIHASSHMGVASSLALASQNINSETKDVVGGSYGRVDGSNEPNGYLEENAFIQFMNNAPMISIERLMQLMDEALDIYASYGVTTIQEGMVAKELFELLHYAATHHVLKQDVIGFVDIAHCKDLLLNNKTYKNCYRNHLKLGGFKTFLDGSPQGRTAWMSTPYVGSDDYYGYPTLKDEQLYKYIYDALSSKQQLLAHCNGDAACEQYITQFEKVISDHPDLKPIRPVMIHAQLVRKDQLERMKALNMIPSFFMAHVYYWGDIHIRNFSKERADLISPANDALKLNMPFTFHQDSPVLKPDMLKTVWCAVNRLTKDGVVLGEDERILVYDALKAITVYPAYQYFEEDLKGTIEVGKKADLVILDKNPLRVESLMLDQIKVLETIKDGKSIYKLKI